MNYVTAEEAVDAVQSNDNVFVHTAAAAPQQLVNALTRRHRELRSVNIYHLHTEGEAPYTHPEYSESLRSRVFFSARNTRAGIATGDADYIRIFLIYISHLFTHGYITLAVA